MFNGQPEILIRRAPRQYIQLYGFPYDSEESYTVGVQVNGLNGGSNWPGYYVDSTSYASLQTNDDMESYSVSADLNGLNGGTSWGGSYASSDNAFTLKDYDDMESYTNGAALNGLIGGTGLWNNTPYYDA